MVYTTQRLTLSFLAIFLIEYPSSLRVTTDDLSSTVKFLVLGISKIFLFTSK